MKMLITRTFAVAVVLILVSARGLVDGNAAIWSAENPAL